ncbi:hypothetical protein LEN26_007547 [Aphanomyces euteiches]|nr:hypothetical protein AeMF1_003707 [Aphanomyces euteiches]KAH9131964.1 hypothetical protein LEN26_007547 [Aphanomyces euteiches]KAH9194327.1 hypothetical protein AeNC1_003683 [Aphanomyces euteiches]
MLQRLASFLAASVALAAAASSTSVTWYSCPLQTIAKNEKASSDNPTVECADISVPLCYDSVCSSTKQISVFVKRIPAQSPGATPQAMWMLQGGPGESSVNMEPLMADAYIAAKRTVSIYTMDHRGTGRSTRLSCAEDNDPYDAKVTVSCLQQVKKTYGSVAPQAFSVTSAANDLATVISTVLADSEVFVYGLSYGTYLVERLMHLAPPAVKGYILDSIQSEQFYPTKDSPWYSNWDRDVADAVTNYLNYCDQDSTCASKIGPNSKSYIQGLYAKLDAATDNACAEIFRPDPPYEAHPSWIVNTFLYSLFTDYNQRNLIPAVLYRLNRCNADDQVVMKNALNMLTNSSSSQLLQSLGKSKLMINKTNVLEKVAYMTGDGSSQVVYNNIVLSEIWQFPSPSRNQSTQWFEAALFGAQSPLDQDTFYQDICIYIANNDSVCSGLTTYDASFTYTRDAYWNKTATIPTGASVLMFTGALDPATPLKYSKDEYETMVGTSKLRLEFAYAPHVIVSQTPTDAGDCGSTILNAFVVNHGSLTNLPTDCIPKVYKLNFTTILDKDTATQIFGSTKDIYGSGAAGANPSNSSGSSSGGGGTSGGSASSSSPRAVISSFMLVVCCLFGFMQF